jgi:subtilisin family serine protease
LAGCSLSVLELTRAEIPPPAAAGGGGLAGSWFEGEILIGYEDEQALMEIVRRLDGRLLELIPKIRAALVAIPPDLTVPDAVARLTRERPRGLRYAEPNYIRDLIAPRPAWPDPDETIAQDVKSQQVGRFNDPLRPRQYALDLMRAEEAWELATGRGVIIGIVDTGMDGTHPELRGKQVAGMDCLAGELHPPDFDSSQYEDSHATHVAGIAAARGNNAEGIVGVAPDAKIMIVQIFNAKLISPRNRSGYVGDAKVAKCLIWAATLGPDGVEGSGDEADVLNNSWGGRGYGQTLKEAIDTVIENGVAFVNSMGNSSEDEVLYPKNYPGVLPVGATDPQDRKVDFSTMGHRISVGAPGEDVISSVPLWLIRPTGESYKYMYFSGTSMSAPQVSGAIALLVERFPEATPYQLQKILEQTADDIELSGFDRLTGWGRPNLARALRVRSLPEDGASVLVKVVTRNRGDTNDDGRIDEADEQVGVPFVDVFLRSDGLDKYFVQTNAQGEALFLSIEPGEYEVRVGGGDATIHRFRLANRITQTGRVRAVSGQESEVVFEFNTTLKVTIRWEEPVDIDLLIKEPRPGGAPEWALPAAKAVWASPKVGVRWGEFSADSKGSGPGPYSETYTLAAEHYPNAPYPIAISAEHAAGPAEVTVIIEQNGIAEVYGPYVLRPGRLLPSSEWHDWWENFPDPERDFEDPGPGAPWVY